MKYLNCKLCYQQLHLKYLCNLARYWWHAPWGWHDSVETFRIVVICEIIVHLMVKKQNKIKKNKIKKYTKLFLCDYPQELAQGAVCQSHTGHMTGLWFLLSRPLRLNTNEWMNVYSGRQVLNLYKHAAHFFRVRQNSVFRKANSPQLSARIYKTTRGKITG